MSTRIHQTRLSHFVKERNNVLYEFVLPEFCLAVSMELVLAIFVKILSDQLGIGGLQITSLKPL